MLYVARAPRARAVVEPFRVAEQVVLVLATEAAIDLVP
jgi:hypothetical protein